MLRYPLRSGISKMCPAWMEIVPYTWIVIKCAHSSLAIIWWHTRVPTKKGGSDGYFLQPFGGRYYLAVVLPTKRTTNATQHRGMLQTCTNARQQRTKTKPRRPSPCMHRGGCQKGIAIVIAKPKRRDPTQNRS